MPEFKIKCEYKGKEKQKFFNDKGPQEYYKFSVVDSEEKVIPDKYLYFTKKNRGVCYCCWIWISANLLKKTNINFGEPPPGKEYRFIINLGEDKTAKFNANNYNNMVLKTQQYFENTVQKIGFWGSESYFYETNKKKKIPSKPNQPNSNPTSRQTIGKIILICLPILVFVFLLLLLIKWVGKKKN